MPDRELAAFLLPPTGETVLTPPLGGETGSARIVVEGVFHFAYAGIRFDALYRTQPDGSYTEPHPFLRWSPRAPKLISQDVGNHRYVFEVPEELVRSGQSLGLRVDVDRLVSDYLITPSEVKQSLSGEVRMQVLQSPPPPVSIGAILGWAGVPTLLTVGGVGWVMRRRMRFQGLGADLRERLERIDARYAGAVKAARAGADRLLPVGDRLQSLQKSALGLARQAQELRDARAHLDRARLEREIAAQRERLAGVLDPAVRRDAQSVLAEKEKSLVLFGELEAAEARCVVRLEKIEAVLDSTALSLRGSRGHSVAATSARDDDALCRALDAEVDAIREVQQELVRCGQA